jgi:hypothetical protein
MEQRLPECLRPALQQSTSALFCNSPSTKLRETCFVQLAKLHRGFSLFLYSAMSTVTAISSKPKATRKRLKKEILSDDFKTRKIFWKNIAENFLYEKIFYGNFSTSHH